MLGLDDPLWAKLDDAYGMGGVNLTLAELADAWDDGAANEFFWSNLCHQGTVYAATYAAVPHLLAIAEPPDALAQRREIAFVLAVVVVSALTEPGSALPGLPETVEAWERKREPYRYLADHSDRAATYRSYLAIPVPTERELAAIAEVGVDFRASLPRVRALCERALRESDDPYLPPRLLGGIAACEGLLGLAELLLQGAEGQLRCAACGTAYEYVSFGDQMVFYAYGGRNETDRAVLDHQDGAPSRADGVVVPVMSMDSCPDAPTRALYRLAAEAGQGLRVLQNLAGEFDCVRCGVRRRLVG